MIKIRNAQSDDATAIARIYGHYVQTTAFTFEETPPSESEIGARMERITEAGLIFLVAENASSLLGYAYASPFHNRSAYRFTVENSVYVSPEHTGHGTGTALMKKLIEDCSHKGLTQMIARIGDSKNLASAKLHQRLGFRKVGVLQSVGLKFGRWVDVVEMQLALEADDNSQ